MKRCCSVCGTIIDKNKLAKHLNEQHNKDVVDCKTCFELFEMPEDVSVHWFKYHGPESSTCEFCGQGFTNLRALRAHELYHSLLYCSACGISYENNACFQYHQTQCKSKKTTFDVFECHHCGLQYDKKPSLRIHIIQKHLNVLPFVCQTCGKRASTLPHLKSHELTHKKERKTWQCYNCGSSFRTELGYRLHMRIHSGIRPYKCELCNESFLSSSRRSDHVKRRHKSTKDMPHGCDRCTAKFIRPWELKKHYLNVHSSIVEVTPQKRTVNHLHKRLKVSD